MLTCKNTTSQKAVNYFKHDHSPDKTRWSGKGAQRLNLSGAVDEKIFFNLMNGRSPDGDQQITRQPFNSSTRRAAIDCTFCAPKSVSLTALVAGDTKLVDAHLLAVEKTLALIEERYTSTRLTAN